MEKLVLDFFLISLDLMQFVFIVCLSQELLKYIKTKVLITCFCLNKAFLRNKKRFGTSLPVSFSALFLKEGIAINPQNLIVSLLLLLEILGNMCIIIIYILVYDVRNFEINLSFLIKPFSYKTKRVRTKI